MPLSFPHIAAGGGYTTQLVLLNTTSAAIAGRVRFNDDGGAPLALLVDGTSSSDLAYSLPPNGTYFAQITSATGLFTGSATVTPNSGQSTPSGTENVAAT